MATDYQKLETFHLFPDLPAELRLDIWNMAIERGVTYNIGCVACTTKDPNNPDQDPDVTNNSTDASMIFPRPEETDLVEMISFDLEFLRTQTAGTRAIMSTCVEARAEALRAVTKVNIHTPLTSRPIAFYCNPDASFEVLVNHTNEPKGPSWIPIKSAIQPCDLQIETLSMTHPDEWVSGRYMEWSHDHLHHLFVKNRTTFRISPASCSRLNRLLSALNMVCDPARCLSDGVAILIRRGSSPDSVGVPAFALDELLALDPDLDPTMLDMDLVADLLSGVSPFM